MNYALNDAAGKTKQASPMKALRDFMPYLSGERGPMLLAVAAILVNAFVNLSGPLLVGVAIDRFVATREYAGVLRYSGILLALYVVAFVAIYVQTRLMGGVAQRLLFKLRNTLFLKLQELPVAFFQQNASGDLISRINNDTDKLNQFFSQSLMHFVGSAFMIMGAAVFLLVIQPRLGIAALLPAVGLFLATRALSAWIRRQNARSLGAVGGMSAEIQESLDNFKVIVAFNRRDYFRRKFAAANDASFRASVGAGLANTFFIPLYTLSAALAQLVVVAYGVALIARGDFTVGLLISYLTFVIRFYDPLRQIASLWASFQGALAAWDRVSAVLSMPSDMPVIPAPAASPDSPVLAFRSVRFGYAEGRDVLKDVDFTLKHGKTYAFVGPTGGGKTTTASLMARLYDPLSGTVLLNGRDIRSYEPKERAERIGFILQEPFLFTGTVGENILYGNASLRGADADRLKAELEKKGLAGLLTRFEKGLETPVTGGDALSLGQRQLIAFIRAVLRDPDLLILDEATANVDTVTEAMLEDILRKLPSHAARVIIAHRLNTIENADEIFFVNGGGVTPAGSMEHAVEMLLHHKRRS
jgi:ATP-binding cassette, subfamily B, bacterial